MIALGLVYFGANYAPWLYQSLGMLAVAYTTLFLPAAVGALRASLAQARPEFEEAARSLGKSPLATLLTVTLPLARPGILTGAALVFLLTMKELPATLILSPIGFTTLASSIWSAAEEAFFARAAAPALLLVAVSSPAPGDNCLAGGTAPGVAYFGTAGTTEADAMQSARFYGLAFAIILIAELVTTGLQVLGAYYPTGIRWLYWRPTCPGSHWEASSW